MGEKQLSFADGLSDPRLGANRRLEAIGAAIDWAPLAALAARLRPGRTGRPPYEPLVMLKALLLQRLYGLSDPQLEEALLDRLSFRRFCGFAAGEGAPDETTLCRFRQDAAESGVLEACLDEVNRQLAANGLMLKTGTLIDATIIAAKSRKPERAAGLGAQVPCEPDAGWTKKNGRSHFGYRLHAGVDEGSGLIRRLVLTPARVNESLVADDLICGDERAVYGDKGYESKERRARLKARGIKDRIMHRSHKNQAALPRWQARRNALIAPRRAAVERVFGTLKRLHGLARARCSTLARNLGDMIAFAIVHNLRRAAALTPA
jgi:IS5 family transposase